VSRAVISRMFPARIGRSGTGAGRERPGHRAVLCFHPPGQGQEVATAAAASGSVQFRHEHAEVLPQQLPAAVNETPEIVSFLAEQYKDTVVQWHSAFSDPSAANKLFRRAHALAKAIRQSPEGRAAIEALLDDPVTAVRLSAAGDSLARQSPRGEAVLERSSRQTRSMRSMPGGHCGLTGRAS
jgi:hypothetical protein